jgi:pyruvate/2-oxoglutarate dehydrogenase complex dihydrolipoamide dehydrogenase (E3) component
MPLLAFPAKTEAPDIASARARHRAAHEALLAADRALIIGAGPAGLELAGEIKAFFPDKHVTIADVSQDILNGPYDQALRDELRRQLDALGVELRLGTAITELPSVPPATLAPIAIATADGGELVADIWFGAFGVRAHSEYLESGALEDRRDEHGYVRVDEHLRVLGETQTFALGDLADADRDMAGIAGVQAGVRSQHPRAHHRHRRAHQLRDVPNNDRNPARARGRSRPPPRRHRRRRHDRRPQGPPHGHRPLHRALRQRPALGCLKVAPQTCPP